jgi:hypothetical protein
MPSSTTPSKYPYPLATEPVRDGALRIQELATALQDGPGDVTVYRNGSWTMAVGWSKVTAWTGARYASANAAAQGMAAHSSGINVPAGRYQVDAQVTFLTDGGGTTRRMAIGTQVPAAPNVDMPQGHLPPPAGTSPATALCVSGTYTMDVAGQIGVFVYTNGSAQALDATQFRLSAHRIS